MMTLTHDFQTLVRQDGWLFVILLILLITSLFHWVSRKIYFLFLKKLDKKKHIWLTSFVHSVHVPWLIFFWLFAFSFIVPIIMLRFHLEITRLDVINTIRSLLFIGAFYWSFMNFITKMEEVIAPQWARPPLRDKTTVRAIAQISRIILTVIIALSILPLLGFSTGSLLAFGGVSGVAAALSAKDALANFFGGMMILWDRPFSVGDQIRSPDRNLEGTVEYIGWRLTRIRTSAKVPLYVPNSVFSSIIIENPSRMTNRQINTTIGVRYDDTAMIEPIVHDITQMLRTHPNLDTTHTTMAHLVECAASSLNLNIYAFTKTTDLEKYRTVQQDVFLKAIAIITKHGAECAFPTKTVHLVSGE